MYYSRLPVFCIFSQSNSEHEGGQEAWISYSFLLQGSRLKTNSCTDICIKKSLCTLVHCTAGKRWIDLYWKCPCDCHIWPTTLNQSFARTRVSSIAALFTFYCHCFFLFLGQNKPTRTVVFWQSINHYGCESGKNWHAKGAGRGHWVRGWHQKHYVISRKQIIFGDF